MIRLWQTSPFGRTIILSLAFSGIGCFVIWDYSRVDRDFRQLKALLTDTRLRAIRKNETLIARFVGK